MAESKGTQLVRKGTVKELAAFYLRQTEAAAAPAPARRTMSNPGSPGGMEVPPNTPASPSWQRDHVFDNIASNGILVENIEPAAVELPVIEPETVQQTYSDGEEEASAVEEEAPVEEEDAVEEAAVAEAAVAEKAVAEEAVEEAAVVEEPAVQEEEAVEEPEVPVKEPEAAAVETHPAESVPGVDAGRTVQWEEGHRVEVVPLNVGMDGSQRKIGTDPKMTTDLIEAVEKKKSSSSKKKSDRRKDRTEKSESKDKRKKDRRDKDRRERSDRKHGEKKESRGESSRSRDKKVEEGDKK